MNRLFGQLCLPIGGDERARPIIDQSMTRITHQNVFPWGMSLG
jgi:hypothetical protein